jgi:hypothetical protein
MDKQTIVGCIRASPEGPPTESILSSCNECGYPIYIAKSTPVIKGARYLCLHCIPWNDVTDVMTPTIDQMSDVLRSRNRRQK